MATQPITFNARKPVALVASNPVKLNIDVTIDANDPRAIRTMVEHVLTSESFQDALEVLQNELKRSSCGSGDGPHDASVSCTLSIRATRLFDKRNSVVALHR